AICALCDSRPIPGEYSVTPSTASARPIVMKPKPRPAIPAEADPAETFHRQRATPAEPAEDLTPDQQALDQRLRTWRKAESEKLGLPLFFVLASTTLRSIVLARPQTLTQLKTIQGIGLEKIEKFGPGILEVCTA
ncbi:MAG TPA: HRDC domain-containing protein, partial [Edaphobacter sp.]|nr:HRDC domain-containing protein [Edaphobacter sp.]